jgi:hypothetical protein
MADQTISDMSALSAAPGKRHWPGWRRVADWALIGAAIGALLWLTVTAWASLTWFVIGLVIYELLLPLVNRLARAMPRPLAAAIGVLLVLGVVAVGVAFLAPPLVTELRQLYASLPSGVQLQQTYATAYRWYEAVVPADVRSVVASEVTGCCTTRCRRRCVSMCSICSGSFIASSSATCAARSS